MSDKELAKALLQLDASELADFVSPQEQTRRVLDKDRRRVKLLAAITVLLWVGSAGAFYWFLFSLVGSYGHVMQDPQGKVDAVTADILTYLLVVGASIEGLIFAVLCTLLLMFALRRATLRKVNANLLEISEQLKRLNQGAAEADKESSP